MEATQTLEVYWLTIVGMFLLVSFLFLFFYRDEFVGSKKIIIAERISFLSSMIILLFSPIRFLAVFGLDIKLLDIVLTMGVSAILGMLSFGAFLILRWVFCLGKPKREISNYSMSIEQRKECIKRALRKVATKQKTMPN